MLNQLQTIRDLIEDWESKQGHDKCWYYPEIFAAIKAALGLPATVHTPPCFSREEFRAGCERHGDEIYSPAQSPPP